MLDTNIKVSKSDLSHLVKNCYLNGKIETLATK